mgnify:CR=1 FL=1
MELFHEDDLSDKEDWAVVDLKRQTTVVNTLSFPRTEIISLTLSQLSSLPKISNSQINKNDGLIVGLIFPSLFRLYHFNSFFLSFFLVFNNSSKCPWFKSCCC